MIVVTGSNGFLGKTVCNRLQKMGREYVATSLSYGLDLRDQDATLEFFSSVNPKYVLNCAAYVGGIQFGQKFPIQLFHNNLKITLNLLDALSSHKGIRLINPISNCAYPGASTIFKEEEFWDGPLHESVMVYGFVRKASWIGSWAYAKQCGLDTINLIFPNMYGPNDHFEEERSHALGALIMKICEAKRNNSKSVVVWGSGKPVREWMHIEDGAEAMIRAMDAPSTSEPTNVGFGKGITIIETVNMIKEILGYQGDIILDSTKPDGAPCKIMDGKNGERLLGWKPSRDFREGVKETIDWYIDNIMVGGKL